MNKKWAINSSSVQTTDNTFTADLMHDNKNDELKIIVYVMEIGTCRIRVEPTNKENVQRFDTSKVEQVFDQKLLNSRMKNVKIEIKGNSATIYCKQGERLVSILYSPLKIIVGDKVEINSHDGLIFQHYNDVPFEEDFEKKYIDYVKYGITAVGLDVSFVGKNIRLSGFNEKLLDLNLLDTSDDEPLRLTNIDRYSTYGNVPLVYAHSSNHSSAVFWTNPSDSYALISTSENSRDIRFLSEGGYVDLLVFTGDPKTITKDYTELTGKPMFAPMPMLGYQQSKWGYLTQNESETVIKKLDEIGFPLDVFWLDVDHLQGYAPFKFNPITFPEPEKFISMLKNTGRYLVRLSDCHLPANKSHVQFNEASNLDYLVKTLENEQYFGECWPGNSSWPDFINPKVQHWWGQQYNYNVDVAGDNVFFWNDMNEPSVFNQIEGTMPKHNLHHTDVEDQGYEHREVHNLYGLLQTYGTHEGLINRNEDKSKRPFLLTRSFFAGSQKYTWTWSGDNTADWSYLKKSISITLSSGLTGIPFTGTDVGGFYDNPTKELLIRWYQVGAWIYPLFREHCANSSPYREPYLFDKETQKLLLDATNQRYHFLPFWYTAMKRSSITGIPIDTALFYQNPSNEEIHDIDDQVILDESVMVAPILDSNAAKRFIKKPSEDRWFELNTGKELLNDENITVDISSIPVYIKGGKSIFSFTETGNNTQTTLKKPMTIYIAVDKNGYSEGDIYLDDGITFEFEKGNYLSRIIKYENNKLKIYKNDKYIKLYGEEKIPKQYTETYINKIIIYGAKSKPSGFSHIKFDNCVYTISDLHMKLSELSSTSSLLYVLIGVVSLLVIIIIICIIICCIRKKNDSKQYYESLNVINVNE